MQIKQRRNIWTVTLISKQKLSLTYKKLKLGRTYKFFNINFSDVIRLTPKIIYDLAKKSQNNH
jgi:hypothetical protein